MNRISIVTGAGTGIGRALTLELVSNYDKKILGIGRRLRKLQELELYYPERIKICQADISTPEGRTKIYNTVPPNSTIEFLVHNAAVLGPVKPLMEITLEEWRKHMSTNVEGPLFLTQILLPKLVKSRVLHISSGAAHNAYSGWGAYCTSKSALHRLYQVLRDELKKKKIIVGSVRPGVVDTPMQDEVRNVTEDIFPSLAKFVALKTNSELIDPKIVGQQLAKLLCRTSESFFSDNELDLRELNF